MLNQVWVSCRCLLLNIPVDARTEDEDTSKIPDVSIVESSAEMLYGLVHQRYILTRAGLQAMVRNLFLHSLNHEYTVLRLRSTKAACLVRALECTA
jgi:hypothetical protein